MSSSYVSVALRRLVANRASLLCEYCLIHEEDAFFGCEVDHIVSEKHGGKTTAENLAHACTFCNRYKGSDIGSVALESSTFTRFYNPRTDRWADHFALREARIIPLTPIGEITERILRFNTENRLLERETLREVGRYPNPAGHAVMQP